MTVVETPEFLRRSSDVFASENQAQLVYFIGSNPEAEISFKVREGFESFAGLCQGKENEVARG